MFLISSFKEIRAILRRFNPDRSLGRTTGFFEKFFIPKFKMLMRYSYEEYVSLTLAHFFGSMLHPPRTWDAWHSLANKRWSSRQWTPAAQQWRWSAAELKQVREHSRSNGPVSTGLTVVVVGERRRSYVGALEASSCRVQHGWWTRFFFSSKKYQ